MKGTTHVVFGIGTGVGFQILAGLKLTGILAYPSYYGGVVLGALLPDIDHPQSYLGRRLKILSVPIHRIFGHRGFTHSPLSLLILGGIMAVFWAKNPLLFAGILIGYFSHLLGDMLTPMGIPLLYPKPERFSLLPGRRNRHE